MFVWLRGQRHGETEFGGPPSGRPARVSPAPALQLQTPAYPSPCGLLREGNNLKGSLGNHTSYRIQIQQTWIPTFAQINLLLLELLNMFQSITNH